jgi:hypothetical protein
MHPVRAIASFHLIGTSANVSLFNLGIIHKDPGITKSIAASNTSRAKS